MQPDAARLAEEHEPVECRVHHHLAGLVEEFVGEGVAIGERPIVAEPALVSLGRAVAAHCVSALLLLLRVRDDAPAVDHAVGRGPVECVQVDRIAGLLDSRDSVIELDARGDRAIAAVAHRAHAIGVEHPAGEVLGHRLVVEWGDPAVDPVSLAELDLARNRRLSLEAEPSPDRVAVAVCVEAEPGAAGAGIIVLKVKVAVDQVRAPSSG